MQSQIYNDDIDFRGLSVHVVGLQRQACRTCGKVSVTSGQSRQNQQLLRSAYQTQRDETRLRLSLLPAEEIAVIRARLRLTQRDASVLLGGGPNAFQRYESGEVLQSKAMDQLLRLLSYFGPQAIDVLAGRPPTRVEWTGVNVNAFPRNLFVRLNVGSDVTGLLSDQDNEPWPPQSRRNPVVYP